jgi:hypothetical protein
VAGPRLGPAIDDQARFSGQVSLLDQLDLTALEQAAQLLNIGLVEADTDLDCRSSDPSLTPRIARDRAPTAAQLPLIAEPWTSGRLRERADCSSATWISAGPHNGSSAAERATAPADELGCHLFNSQV